MDTICQPRELHASDIRSRILLTARALFAELGYHATTMRQVARRTGCSTTSIYAHFKDKASLLHEIADADSLALVHHLLPLADSENPVERLRQLADAYLTFATEQPDRFRVMFMSQRPIRLDLDQHPRRGIPVLDAYAFVEATVAQAMLEGSIRTDRGDAALVAQVLWAGVHGVISLHLAKAHEPWVGWQPLERTLSLMVDSLLGSLGTAQEVGHG